jgi:hypothetical protein
MRYITLSCRVSSWPVKTQRLSTQHNMTVAAQIKVRECCQLTVELRHKGHSHAGTPFLGLPARSLL